MSHSKHDCQASWLQATLDRANSLRDTALLASIPLLEVVSERTLNIVDAVQYVKNFNKAGQDLVTETTVCAEAFCNSYRHSMQQKIWPSNGVKALLHALCGILDEIEKYIKDQKGKSRAGRFFSSASNGCKIKIFLQRLDNIINKLENLENVTESVTIALRDSLHDIRLLMSPNPSPNTPDEAPVNGCTSADQGRAASTSILPSPCSTREISEPSANTTIGSTQIHSSDNLFAAHLPKLRLGATHSVSPLSVPDDRPSSSSLPPSTVTSLYSVGDSNISQGAESPLNHTAPSNQSHFPASLLPDQRDFSGPPPPPGFPLPHPMPWVIVPSQAFSPQFIVLLAQDTISRLPPTTINISNIGNSNDTTTIG